VEPRSIVDPPPGVTDPGAETPPGVHPTAVIDAIAAVAPGASIGACAVVRAGTTVGEGARIGAHVVIGRGCRIGAGAVLAPHVTLYDGVELGEGVVVGSGSRIGPDGFGFVWDGSGHRKIPQVGRVVIGARSVLGSNVTVDRGSIGDTVIGADCRIADLVHVGHNARFADGVSVDALTGISGSTIVERGASIGWQGATSGHLTIGEGTRVLSWGGVTQDIAAGEVVAGTPARPVRDTRRAERLTRALPRLIKRLEALERAVRGRTEPTS
jgi:UDP-3-O-[3-hydroxymyristoyl] glucosamine N-acyltransferase